MFIKNYYVWEYLLCLELFEVQDASIKVSGRGLESKELTQERFK